MMMQNPLLVTEMRYKCKEPRRDYHLRVRAHICKTTFVQVQERPVAAAAAAAKLLQSCPTLCDPIDGSPPGSPVPSPSGYQFPLVYGLSFLFLAM